MNLNRRQFKKIHKRRDNLVNGLRVYREAQKTKASIQFLPSMVEEKQNEIKNPKSAIEDNDHSRIDNGKNINEEIDIKGSISVLDMCQNMGIEVMDLNGVSDEDEDEDKNQQIKDLMNLVDMLKNEIKELKIKLEKMNRKESTQSTESTVKVEEVEEEEVEEEVEEEPKEKHWIVDIKFKSLNVKELRQICKRLGMKGYSKLTRSVLLENLEAAREYAMSGEGGGYSYTGLSVVRK